jgi:putative membrane protein
MVTNLLNAVVFAILGVAIFVVLFVILDKMTPYHLWKEVVEDKNVALAILVGTMALGISIIIAAAVHG